MSVDSLNANYSFKYLGKDKGVSVVSFIDKTGIDIAPGMIEVAKARSFEKLICQSIEEDFDVPDETFDAAIAIGVMEFIKFPGKFLERISEKLKVDGICGLTVPKPADSKLDILSYSKDNFLALIDMRLFSLIEVAEFFGYEKQGERVEYNAFFLRRI